MSKSLKALAGAIVVLFLLAILGLVALSSQAPAESRAVAGGFERAVSAADEADLTITAVSPMDVYGEDFIAAMPVCPGATPEDVTGLLGLNGAPEGMEEEVPEGTNYLVLIRMDGTAAADAIPQESIDLCAGGQLPPFNAAQMLPLIKDPSTDAWTIAV